MTRRAVTYASYLNVPELLALQVERSRGADGTGAEHDELLFIVIHQVYELWFKQVRHELLAVQRALEADDTDRALHCSTGCSRFSRRSWPRSTCSRR